MLFEFLGWWYGRGWLKAVQTARGWVREVEREFSAGILIKTLFSPWKQIVSLPGQSIDEKFRATLDNLVSRSIGFIVRLITLLSAGVLLILALILGLLLVIAWPFGPLAFVYLVFRSVKG
ncbi:MAG TPA: hypothetical protein VEH48_00505 [Candidatus Nitrosopolaris sp.]|nr:hypothetical protein [Candidatus Nitrosopolaris sp.]